MEDDPGLGGGGGESNVRTQKRDRAYIDNQTVTCVVLQLN